MTPKPGKSPEEDKPPTPKLEEPKVTDTKEVTVIEFKEASGYLWWWLLRYSVGTEERTGLVYNNWVKLGGELVPGEKVEVALAKIPVYTRCPYDFFSVLKRESSSGGVSV